MSVTWQGEKPPNRGSRLELASTHLVGKELTCSRMVTLWSSGAGGGREPREVLGESEQLCGTYSQEHPELSICQLLATFDVVHLSTHFKPQSSYRCLPALRDGVHT